jgi:hypothetical protein
MGTGRIIAVESRRQRADEPAVPPHALRPDRPDADDHAHLQVRRHPQAFAMMTTKDDGIIKPLITFA